MSWRDLAACADHPRDLWFPGSGGSHDPYSAARVVCNDCPVRTECGEYAQRNDIEYGMWGGMSPKERGVPQYRRTQSNAVRCGTRSGYDTHRRKGEESCEPCKVAAAEYMRSRRQA